MDRIKVMKYLEENKDFLFPNNKYKDQDVENALIAAPDSFEMMMESITFRKPSTVQNIAIFPGSLGVDRFYLGDIWQGILKYFSFGGAGIWWIIDIVNAKSRCREYNCKKLLMALRDPSAVSEMQVRDDKIRNTVNTVKQLAPAIKDAAKEVSNIGDSFYVDK